MSSPTPPSADPGSGAVISGELRRALGLWVLVLYGLGMIVGAGIYVLVGEVAGVAGWSAPFAFLLSAVLAALTGLSYAELVGRFPEAAGEVAYVQQAFGRRWLATLMGLSIVALASAAAASIARGTAGYLHAVIPWTEQLPDATSGVLLIVVFTLIACWGVRQSAWLAAGLTLLEIGGLLLIIGLGADSLGSLPARLPDMIPGDWPALIGVFAGAYVAFFAYLGFENLANMAEEAHDPGRVVARAIVISIFLSALLYGLVSLVAVLSVGPEKLDGARAPLCLVVERAGFACGKGFAILALIALSNGIIVEIMLVGRLLFGMARRRLLPGWLGKVGARSKVPVRGTIVSGSIVLALAAGLPFEWLVNATSGITLGVFALVNLSLWRLHRTAPAVRRADAYRVPRWLPPLGALLCGTLLVIAIVNAIF